MLIIYPLVMRPCPCGRSVQTAQVKGDGTKPKLTEEWGCESGNGAAFPGSTTWTSTATVIGTGCERSGTCSGF